LISSNPPALDISRITADLFVGKQPSPQDYALLHALNIGLVINMRWETGPYADPAPEPLPTLWLRTFDSPLLPIPAQQLARGVEQALETIQRGYAVYAHCARGIHRGPAMGTCILIAQGYATEEAIQLVKQQRPGADPGIFYMRWSINRFARRWAQDHR
jgi:protein tyrosine/serine phosphatase